MTSQDREWYAALHIKSRSWRIFHESPDATEFDIYKVEAPIQEQAIVIAKKARKKDLAQRRKPGTGTEHLYDEIAEWATTQGAQDGMDSANKLDADVGTSTITDLAPDYLFLSQQRYLEAFTFSFSRTIQEALAIRMDAKINAQRKK